MSRTSYRRTRCHFGPLTSQTHFPDRREEAREVGEYECEYCGAPLATYLERRVSTGFGLANETFERFCDRRCRGLYDLRGGAKWSRVDGRDREDAGLAQFQIPTPTGQEQKQESEA